MVKSLISAASARIQLAFVSNIKPGQRSGGFSGMSTAIAKALGSRCELHYVGPINPAPHLLSHAASKLRRVVGLTGAFFFFSEARLRRIAEDVERKLSTVPHQLCFFHGFTPWVAVRCAKPYLAWSDCTFSQYISVFHDRKLFSKSDLARITDREVEWLKAARSVFFRNRWAAAGAISEYGLDPAKIVYVGNCGMIDPPLTDTFAGGMEFLFVSTNFEAKNGSLVLKSFEQLRRKHPDARLTIIGDPPPCSRELPKGVRYEGYLRKNVASEASKLSAILARSTALLHPTLADTNPMVLIEAGYFGCPSISTRICGIPEMIDDGVTGYLIDYPVTLSSLTDTIERLLSDEKDYNTMRRAVREKMCGQFSQRAFEERIVNAFQSIVSGFGWA